MLIRTLLLALICLPATVNVGHAQDKKAEQEAVRRVQQKMRQLEQEKTQLMRDKEQLTLEKEELAKGKSATELTAKGLREQLMGSRRKLNEETAKAGLLTKDLESAQVVRRSLLDKLAEVERQFEETRAKLKLTEDERRRFEDAGLKFRETVAMQTKNIDLCESNNKKLYQYGTELIDRYQRKTCRDVLLQAEPMTGLKRVEIESLMEDYNNKMRDQRFPR